MGQKENIKNEGVKSETSSVLIEIERAQKEHRSMKNKERNYQESV